MLAHHSAVVKVRGVSFRGARVIVPEQGHCVKEPAGFFIHHFMHTVIHRVEAWVRTKVEAARATKNRREYRRADRAMLTTG